MNWTRRSWLGALPLATATGRAAPQTGPSGSLAAELTAEISKLPVVDTHEHILPESQRVKMKADFFLLAGHYAINDVISAGLPEDSQKLVRDENAPAARRWAAFEPYWKHARFTGYGQALRIAIRDIYGVEEISAATLTRINDAIAAKNRKGLYRDILQQRSGIEYALVDDYWNPAPVKPEDPFFVPARKFDRFITPQSADSTRKLEELTGVSITSLQGLKRAMEKSFEQSLAIGMVSVKSTMAYSREIHFEEVSEAAAARDFERMMRGAEELPKGFRGRKVRPYRQLEDHMFHYLAKLASEHHKPFQIHTGILAGNGNFVENTNPRGLTNLFFLYPKVKFDLFHIGYPYTGQTASLAKLFPNVLIDFTWAHIISPSVAQRALHEYLDTVPVNKIFGYGGDYRYPELSYAHLMIARRNIAQVLAERVQDRLCTEDEALGIARELLHDGPARVFPRPS